MEQLIRQLVESMNVDYTLYTEDVVYQKAVLKFHLNIDVTFIDSEPIYNKIKKHFQLDDISITIGNDKQKRYNDHYTIATFTDDNSGIQETLTVSIIGIKNVNHLTSDIKINKFNL